ncbi:MAG: hypothetical protein JXA03_08350 [Bacteroidales bacterium]|nr:hypothetical protein [Bacteroidales bacterium]
MKKVCSFLLASIFIAASTIRITAQEVDTTKWYSESNFTGLRLRNIGPAFMSGRIADIAIHPENHNIWYVAVGSGGVWKTVNSGTTWEPLFDGQKVYSTGCIALDPQNPNTVWVGTGENIGGRHVGFGDGVYRSCDGGKSWENMGLKESQHISKIIIHPGNSRIIWVAAQGPLWNKGGERGIYKSSDGGKTWKQTLGDDGWVGATDLVADPRNPDVMYAATWQRHRNVAAYMGGGPGSGIYRSSDGGETWEKLRKGLPSQDMGKIGLAISPQKPDILYASIELERRTGAVYRSTDRGSSWVKMSETVSGATGPHYYQELYACPHRFDRIYLADVRIQVSDDGGKTFTRLKEENKHSDNHSVAFRPGEPEYLLIGTDGGIYESFDLAETWRFVANLPLTQFYKVAVDDAEPFYNIYGGTQDNGTQGGPSRTANSNGIRNADWNIVLFADGHQPATEPGNPDIMYAEWQQGNLVRIDRSVNEIIHIKPQPEAGEGSERFNWDAPILVSPHSPTRLYFASHRVWRSDNRGDSWTPISGDLTKNVDRMTLPLMEQTWSWDSPWDMDAMSYYSTITSLSESPLKEGLIYAGTDDGLIQVTENNGQSWRKTEVGNIPGIPPTAFVNDIKADLFDVNTVYVVMDNHKYGDLKPYVVKSADMGKSWQSVTGNIPDKTLTWRIVQDHIKPDLLFLATESGIYVTVNAGNRWTKLTGGVPAISFRDLAIQRRENDLVGASFGRSFYVFDDYSVLRYVSEQQLREEATLFPVKDAWWFLERPVLGSEGKASQGDALFTAPNPPFGAVFTYYLGQGYKTKKEIRKEKEAKIKKDKGEVGFPGWDAVEEERREEKPRVWLTVTGSDSAVVRRIPGPVDKGFHRVAWDLRLPAPRAIDVNRPGSPDDQPSGYMAPPGQYRVSLSVQMGGEIKELAGPVDFRVVPLKEGALKGMSHDEIATYTKDVNELQEAVSLLGIKLRSLQKKTEAMQTAVSASPSFPGELDERIHSLKQQLAEIEIELYGNSSRLQVGELIPPTLGERLSVAANGWRNSTYGPTQTHIRSFEIAGGQFAEVSKKVELIAETILPQLEMALKEAGAPAIGPE